MGIIFIVLVLVVILEMMNINKKEMMIFMVKDWVLDFIGIVLKNVLGVILNIKVNVLLVKIDFISCVVM